MLFIFRFNPTIFPLSTHSSVSKPSTNPNRSLPTLPFSSPSSMEFWGVEVKAGAPLKVEAGPNSVLHLSQASLGEVKKDKGNESVPLFLNINDQKLVIGTLFSEKIPQISYDLVMEKDFELSHNWKNGSVHFCGYRSFLDQSDDENTDSDIGHELPVITKENGKPEPKNVEANAGKPKVKIVEPNKDGSDEDSDDDESEEEAMGISEEDSSDEEDEDSSDEEDEDSEEEETPKKAAEKAKKRPAESATKTPVAEKKAKLITPEKTGPEGKKSGSVHVATPHPSKKAAGKTSGSNDKSKQQTPKSAAQVACKSCTKTFNSDTALQSHTKAKHSDGK